MFSEIEFDKITKIEGMNICIVTSAKSSLEVFILLRGLGMPLQQTNLNPHFLVEDKN